MEIKSVLISICFVNFAQEPIGEENTTYARARVGSENLDSPGLGPMALYSGLLSCLNTILSVTFFQHPARVSDSCAHFFIRGGQFFSNGLFGWVTGDKFLTVECRFFVSTQNHVLTHHECFVSPHQLNLREREKIL